MVTVLLNSKLFGEFVRFLKRASIIGKDYYIRNDIWIPRTRLPEGKPGKHMLQGFSLGDNFQDVVWKIDDIRTIISSLDSVTGKKGRIELNIDYTGMDIVLKDGAYSVHIASPTNEKFPEEAKSFDEITSFIPEWTSFTMEELEAIKAKDVIKIWTPDGFPIRLSKSNFKLNGVEQAKNAIKYSGQYATVLMDDNQTGCLYIKMDYQFFKSVHVYVFALYREANGRGFGDL